jgi:hypothetical protein
MTQLSTALILPLMNFSSIIKNSYINTYLGHAEYESPTIWGNYFYLEVPQELLDEILIDNLRNHIRYITELDNSENVFFVFKFSEKEKETIVKPFLEGKYSQISRDYVKKYFSKESSMNWRILNKDEWALPQNIMPLREYWLRRIGAPIPENGEVWPKPKMEHEIFNYVNLDEVLEKELSNINPNETISN